LVRPEDNTRSWSKRPFKNASSQTTSGANGSHGSRFPKDLSFFHWATGRFPTLTKNPGPGLPKGPGQQDRGNSWTRTQGTTTLWVGLWGPLFTQVPVGGLTYSPSNPKEGRLDFILPLWFVPPPGTAWGNLGSSILTHLWVLSPPPGTLLGGLGA